jgi:hypothetical protein
MGATLTAPRAARIERGGTGDRLEEHEMTRDELAARREVRAALQHRRTHRLARFEDMAGRRHEVVAL